MSASILVTNSDSSQSNVVLSSNIRKVVTNGSGATLMAIGKGARLKSINTTQTPAQIASLADGLVAFTDYNDATSVYVNVNSILMCTPYLNGSQLRIDGGYLPFDVFVTTTPLATQAIINANSEDVVGDQVQLTRLEYDFATKVITTTCPQATNIDITTDTITTVAHGYVVNDTLVFSSSTTLPTGISAATAYYVVAKTNDTYQVSATRGGAVLNITAVGTGTLTAKSNTFGTVSFGTAGQLPDKAVVTKTYYDVATTFTSAADTATIALSTTQAANQFVSALAISGVGDIWDAGLHAGIQDGAVANMVKMTAARDIIMPIAVQVITAGKMAVFVEWVLGE